MASGAAFVVAVVVLLVAVVVVGSVGLLEVQVPRS